MIDESKEKKCNCVYTTSKIYSSFVLLIFILFLMVDLYCSVA